MHTGWVKKMNNKNNHKYILPEVMNLLAKVNPDEYGEYLQDNPEDAEIKNKEIPIESDRKKRQKTDPKIKSIHRGHRSRVREKFFNYGLDCFSEFEVLEFLLFHTIPMKDTNEIAHRLIERFGTLKGVFNAEYYDLMEVDGISEVSASLITLQREIFKYLRTKNFKKECLRTSMVAGQFCQQYFENHVEETSIVIMLDDDRNIEGVEIVAKGSETESYFLIRKIVKVLMRYRGKFAIVAHNHPVKYAVPSSDDINSTEYLKLALEKIGVSLIDHIVCSEKEFYSMMDGGYI